MLDVLGLDEDETMNVKMIKNEKNSPSKGRREEQTNMINCDKEHLRDDKEQYEKSFLY